MKAVKRSAAVDATLDTHTNASTHEYAAIQYTYVYTMIRTYEYITHIHQYTCARRFIAQTQTLTSFPMYKEVAKCTTTMAKAIMPQQ